MTRHALPTTGRQQALDPNGQFGNDNYRCESRDRETTDASLPGGCLRRAG